MESFTDKIAVDLLDSRFWIWQHKRMRISYQHPSYTEKVFGRNFSSSVQRIATKVAEIRERYPFDALAGSGNSAAPLLGALSFLTGIPFILVRKESDSCHDIREVNGYIGCHQYLIIDDLISSGATVGRVISRITKEYHRAAPEWDVDSYKQSVPVPAAILLYSGTGYQYQLKYGNAFMAVPVFDMAVPDLVIRPGADMDISGFVDY